LCRERRSGRRGGDDGRRLHELRGDLCENGLRRRPPTLVPTAFAAREAVDAHGPILPEIAERGGERGL
jgi:hypothetical protein